MYKYGFLYLKGEKQLIFKHSATQILAVCMGTLPTNFRICCGVPPFQHVSN